MSVISQPTVKDGLHTLPEFCRLSERVWRVMGLNPGPFTLQGTNTYLVGLGSRKILIDCNDGKPGYVELLSKSLSSLGAYITDIYISHCHEDHIGGVGNVINSDLTKKRKINIHKFANPSETSSPEYIGSIPKEIDVAEIVDNQIIEVDPSTHIRVLHTPGHLKDHCSFYLEEESHMFTGDCVLGRGVPAFEDLSEYLTSLQKILNLKPTRLFPGHGDVVNYGTEKIKEYIIMRQKKDNQILKAMEKSKIWTANSLTSFINPETMKYSVELKRFCVRLIGLHLIKLYNDGKVFMLTKDNYEERTGLKAYNSLTILSAFDEEWTLCSNSKL